MRVKAVIGGLAAIAGFALLCSLGAWQVQRLAWKENLIARQAAALAATPSPLADVIRKPAADRLFWPVTVTGVLQPAPRVLVGLRPREGRPGYHLVLPLQVTEGALAGQLVLVNLGWLPMETAAAWTMPVPEGQPLHIAGIARTPEARNWLTPADDRRKHIWQALDPVGIAAAYGLDHVLPLVVQVRDPLPGAGWPEPLSAKREFRNDHRNYAIFWFTMAGCWTGMVACLWWRGKRKAGLPLGAEPL